ncbi:hypothetical protein NJO91_30130 [Streptomyces microflavus]|uniref:hypothetical protein n=1 Tax=Streptomyces microflavus TaxID=1919 RepID=UPI0029BE936C|nr:hypothetical protein [Streptomyces microflavus]MDX2407371.1 hypothetical protein [Streptomyces microflavus]
MANRKIVLRRKSMSVVTWFFFCLLSFFSFTALASLSRGVDVDALGVASVCLAVVALILRVGRSRVILADLTITVINPIFTYVIPYSGVKRVDEERALTLVTVANEEIHSSAFGSSLIDYFVRSTEHAASEIEARVRLSSRRKGAGSISVVRTLTRAWLANIYGIGALICAVVAVWGGSR